jgi:hypothetical protein
VFLEQVHYFGVVFLGRGLDVGGPVEYVPVVGWYVDQLVVETRLVLVHFVQVFVGEGAEKNAIFQHSSLAGLIQKSGGMIEIIAEDFWNNSSFKSYLAFFLSNVSSSLILYTGIGGPRS